MQSKRIQVAVQTYSLLFTEQYIWFMSVNIYHFGLIDLQYILLGCNMIMPSRKHVTLEKAIDSLSREDNVCSEQALVILPSDQRDGHATK